MLKNPIGLAILAVVAIAGGVWFYFYANDPLHSSCRKLMANWAADGPRTADALYDSLPEAAKARTTREGTRMYLDTVCRTETEDEDVAIGDIRDRMVRNLSAPAP